MFDKKRKELKQKLADIDLNEQSQLDAIEAQVNDYRFALIKELRENQELDRNEINCKLEFLDELESEQEATEEVEAGPVEVTPIF